ncbi:MAG TPA: phytanoyl-CoA dioxygenase family protein [Polyangiaceae bacterium]
MHRSPPHADEVSPSLAENGYVVVRDALGAAHVDRLRAAFEGVEQRDGTQHVPLFDDALASHPAIVSSARVVFGDASWRVRDMPSSVASLPPRGPARSRFRVSMHGRNPLPGYGQQGLHADWKPRARGEPFMVMSAIWMLDDFTIENGATRVVPGSHEIIEPLSKSLAQPLARHEREIVITGSSGSVLIFNGHTWHSGRKNDSRGPRRCVQMVMQRCPLIDESPRSHR